MSKLILPFFTLFICWTFTIQAQITIDLSTFTRSNAYLDSAYTADPSAFRAPTEGADQFWDYGSLVGIGVDYNQHFDATENVDFPDATASYSSIGNFQGLPLFGAVYERVDEDGWHLLGSTSEDITHSIAFISGGLTDSIRFPKQMHARTTISSNLIFPLTYQTKWVNTPVDVTNYELTVAAFGLNQVPGQRVSRNKITREVVGYGNLVIPKADGTPAAPREVLLLKTIIERTDSVFLGGAPAPDLLLGAFGLVQGATQSSTFYNFHTTDFGASILHINMQENTMSYRPQVSDLSTGIEKIRLPMLRSFPNPVQAGQTVTIQTKSLTSIGYFQLADLNGQVVQRQSFDTSSNRQFSMQIPVNVYPGYYLFHVFDKRSQPIGMGKLYVY